MSKRAIMHGYQNIGHVKPDTPELTGCTMYCKLLNFDWYWGNIKRTEAEALVIQNPGTFIIRASQSSCGILCITFLSDFANFKASKVIHMRLQHYKGLFSLDRRNYVPLKDLPQHCTSFGRVNELFSAHALKKDATTRLILRSSICGKHS